MQDFNNKNIASLPDTLLLQLLYNRLYSTDFARITHQ